MNRRIQVWSHACNDGQGADEPCDPPCGWGEVFVSGPDEEPPENSS